MLTMIVNLMVLEEEIKNAKIYLDHLASDFQEFNENPVALNLRDRLRIMEIHLHEALNQWPQLGMEIPLVAPQVGL